MSNIPNKKEDEKSRRNLLFYFIALMKSDSPANGNSLLHRNKKRPAQFPAELIPFIFSLPTKNPVHSNIFK